TDRPRSRTSQRTRPPLVTTANGSPATSPWSHRNRAKMRRPLPLFSASEASGLKMRSTKRPSASRPEGTRTPSAPRPKCRSHQLRDLVFAAADEGRDKFAHLLGALEATLRVGVHGLGQQRWKGGGQRRHALLLLRPRAVRRALQAIVVGVAAVKRLARHAVVDE